ncbi:MAG: methyl-accepting chemotaxis protein, partial [Spirochaetes bacterium]|nr:methyl-accepting chemotaxis protein [Spirochaetota bacterium]
MKHIRDINLKAKVLILALTGIALLSVIISLLYIRDISRQATQGILEKSRAIVYMAESAREAMAEKLASGVITDLNTLAQTNDRNRLLAAVPIITAIDVATRVAEQGEFEFRVPKFSPRNPVNEPVGVEIEILRELEKGLLEEYVLIEDDQIRYFKPIKLTQECMLCHGDPKGSRDPVGGIMEGWKVGEIHGAFEIISSLRSAKQTQGLATINIISFTGGVMLILGLGLFFIIRLVLKPIVHYVDAFKRASTGDLTVRAKVNANDEVGRIALFFNDFIGTLEGMVHEVKEVSGKAERISSKLADSSGQTASGLHEIRINTEGMKNKIVHLDTEVSASTKSASDVGEY